MELSNVIRGPLQNADKLIVGARRVLMNVLDGDSHQFGGEIEFIESARVIADRLVTPLPDIAKDLADRFLDVLLDVLRSEKLIDFAKIQPGCQVNDSHWTAFSKD